MGGEMGNGISGAAVLRVASAMLAALGGDEIAVMLPATATASDIGGLLGLVDPGVRTVTIKPVVARSLPTGNLGPRRRIEFTLPADVVAAQLSELGMGSAAVLFDGALGLMYDSELFHIESVTAESFAGTQYLYKVVAVE